MGRVRLWLVMVLLAMAVLGCAAEDDAGPLSVTDEDYALGDLVEDLNEPGDFRAEEVGPVTDTLFPGAAAQQVRVDGETLEVYEFETAEAAEARSAAVAADASNIDGRPLEWNATPHLYTMGRVIVLYVGDDLTTVDLLSSVMGAEFAGGAIAAEPPTPQP